jgi:DHA2 family multidrug resistance protein
VDFGHDQLILPQIVRALGLPLIMVPLSMITTGQVGKQNAISASGLFNMLRNLGGSFGIALISALLTWREHFHSHHLGEAISVYNPLTQERLSALAQGLVTQGIDLATAQDRAIGLMDLEVRRQSYLLAFSDCFHTVGVLFFGSIVLILLCRKVIGGDAGGAH